jgi:acylphosphatase
MIFEMKVIVHGRVQGVGYRNSVIRFIENNYLDIKGFVKNLPNGTVQIIAQGSREDLESLRKFSSKGSDFSDVDHIEEVSLEIQDYSYPAFEIQY